jgi:hypothetical protein
MDARAAAVAILLLTAPSLALAAEPGAIEGYAWIGGKVGNSDASLVYGFPESPEDIEFLLFCNNKKKTTEVMLYVDIKDALVGQKVALEFSAGSVKDSLDGRFSSDEMNGAFAEAKKFKLKPLLAVLTSKGPVTVKTGAVVTTLPEKGRASETAKFAKACTLD